MPDWKQQLHSAFEAKGHTCDADVLEELSTHAAAAYEALRTDAIANARTRFGALYSIGDLPLVLGPVLAVLSGRSPKGHDPAGPG